MKKAIIHISDLHISHLIDKDGKAIERKTVKSWITTDSKSDFKYIDAFIKHVNKYYSEYELSLIITGDITESGVVEEYDFALHYLKKAIDELKIDLKNILIVPGDHDVNRFDCESAFRNSKEAGKIAYGYNIEKFAKFSNFYKSLHKDISENNAENAIVNHICIEQNKIMIVGLNSNFHIGSIGGDGFIDNEKLKTELMSLKTKYSEYSKIAAFHHNFNAKFTNEAHGQWDNDNLNQIKNTLMEFGYNTYFYGNEHTSSSDIINDIYHSSAGSFACKNPEPSFKIYRVNNEFGKLSLFIDLHKLIKDNHNNNLEFGYWSKIDNPTNERKEIILIEKPKDKNASPKQVTTKLPENSNSQINPTFNILDYDKKLFQIVKAENLFHTGHFHWSETSRAHNWIDISKLLQDKNNLLIAKKSIINIINENELIGKFDYIIGLGMEGNILATRTSIIYDKPYSFLPYSYRYDEHNEYEKELNLGELKDGNSVLIITDVVHDGRTIRKLINKREDNFFEKANKIIVLALFYTGKESTRNVDMMNSENVINFDDITDHIENRIEFYYVSHLKVDECQYDKDFRTECIIYKENLSCVHKFYDEDKAIEKINNRR